MTFFKCKKCGKIVGIVKNSACPTFCCGEPMEEMIPGSVDASAEKHIPQVKTFGTVVAVSVGAVPHPMDEDHFISWIAIQTAQGAQRKELKPGTAPKAAFALVDGDELVAVYAYCNLHGLWKA